MGVDLAQLGTSLLLWMDGDETDLEKNLTEEQGLPPLLPVEDGDGG